MHESTVKGWIGGTTEKTRSMMPTKTPQERQRGGGTEMGYFMRFKMFVPDLTRPREDDGNGNLRRPNMVIQVILPDDERGERWFDSLRAGRYVTVRGYHRLETRAEAVDGKERFYANQIIRARSIQFNDQPPVRAAERLLGQLKDECKVISEKEYDKYLAAFKEYDSTLTANTPGQVVQDSKGKSVSKASNSSNDDEDLDDFDPDVVV